MNATGAPSTYLKLRSRNPEDLDWNKLIKTFKQFGTVRKLFVDKDKKFAKIFYSEESCEAAAFEALKSCGGWNLHRKTENIIGNLNGNCGPAPEAVDSISVSSSNNHSIMEEACTMAGEYVDIHGRSVDVLTDENGHLFVNMDDVRAAGFNIYRKEDYDAISIPKNLEVREFYNYLLSKAQDYMLKFRQPFDPDEIVNIIDRVAAKLGIKETVPNQFAEPPKNTSFSTEHGKVSQKRTTSRLGIKEAVPNQFVEPPRNTSSIENGKNGQRRANATFEMEEQSRSWCSLGSNTKNSFSSTESNRNANGVQQRKGFLKPPGSPNNQDKTVDSSKQCLKNWSEVRQPKFVERNESGRKELKSDVNKTGKNIDLPKSPKPLADAPKTDVPNISRLSLDPGRKYKIKVSYLDPEKSKIFYGQPQEAVEKVQDICLELNSENEINEPDIRKPLRGMLCLAKFEDIWYRAIVCRESLVLGQCVVELLDYGNIEEINTFVKRMPEKLAKIPAQAIRFTLDNNAQVKLEVDEDVEIFVKKQFEQMTHLVTVTKSFEKKEFENRNSVKPEVTNTKKNDEPKEDCFKEVVTNSIKVVPGDIFRIANYSDEKLIVHNKTSIAILKSIYNQIKNLEKQRIKNPEVGQMVLCAKDGEEGLHRAVIKEINNKVANVEFVDYSAQESLALTSLRNVDEDLASFPSVKIEIDFPLLGKLNQEGVELLNDLISQKTKLEAVSHNNIIDLVMPDTRIHLSDKIMELLKATKETKTDSNSITKEPKCGNASTKKSIIKYEDIPEAVVELGLAEYSCYTCTNEGVTLVSMSQENMLYVEKIVGYFPEGEPYTPEPFEMCLVFYLDLWARGMVVSVENDVFEIYFIDYGNNDYVKREDIRQFPKQFLEIPVTGFFASFTGIQKTPEVLKRLQELLADGAIVEADVKSKNGDKYNVEFPSIYEQLRKENLLQ